MGAWDAGVFANDDAADWVGELVDRGSSSPVKKALKKAAKRSPGDYLEAPEGSEALAAAEVVAAAAGRPATSDAYSEAALEWAEQHPEVAKLVDLAQRAVARVAAPSSELREVWLDDPDVEPAAGAEWTRAVEDLQRRLGA